MIRVIRSGLQYDIDENQAWASDLVLCDDDRWRFARDLPELWQPPPDPLAWLTPVGSAATPAPPPKPEIDWFRLAVYGLAGAGAAVALWKLLQAASDVEFNGRCYPRGVREDLIDQHVERHGPFCSACGSYTDDRDFHVDHRLPYHAGGRTSLANARVICAWCNLAKGGTYSIADTLLGRGGRAA